MRALPRARHHASPSVPPAARPRLRSRACPARSTISPDRARARRRRPAGARARPVAAPAPPRGLAQRLELALERRDPPVAARSSRPRLRLREQHARRRASSASQARRDRSRPRDGLYPVSDAFTRRLRGEPRRESSSRWAPRRRQRLLGLLAPRAHRLELALELRRGRRAPAPPAAAASSSSASRLADVVTGELIADLEHLAVKPRVQLGRLGLALQRAQP